MNSFNRTSDSQGPKVYPIFNRNKRPLDQYNVTPNETGGKFNPTKNPRINYTQEERNTSYSNYGQQQVRVPAVRAKQTSLQQPFEEIVRPYPLGTNRVNSGPPKQWVPFKEIQAPEMPRSALPVIRQEKNKRLLFQQEQPRPLPSSSTPKVTSKNVMPAASSSKATKPPSLSFISATIHGVREWSQYKDHLFLLFEVIGIVDSAISRSHNNLAKQFVLRDSSSTINCCFYEIDRELTNVIRRQWYRCVGKLDKRNEVLHSISLRPATSQEQQLFPKFVEMSTREMRMKIMRFNEP